MTVLVCGATGTTGSEVLRQLAARGVPARAMTRSDASADALRREGNDAVVADLAHPETLAPALHGIDAVYVATAASPDLPALEGNLARAAAQAGAGLLVKLSVIGCSADSPITFARLHFQAETAIGAAGLPCTMVRPNGFMQNTLAWSAQLPRGVVFAPIADARWSIVDVRDIAAVAVAALTDPAAHAGEAYTVTGPEASSPREQVAILGALLGRDLVVEEVTVDAAQEAMIAAGWPAWNVERMGELFTLYADGLATTVSPDVERVTGRPARDYRAFAREHLAAFGG